MPQSRYRTTVAQVERMFYVDVVEPPPPLRGEARDAAPPLAAIAPDPPTPVTPAQIEAAQDRQRRAQAKRRGPKPPPIPRPTVTLLTDTRH